MRKYLQNEAVRKNCHILGMLEAHASEKHLSFHTPGHKIAGYDITELSYSDNLSCPSGVILQAEKDVATILGAEASFLLTDGSTAGVLSMLYALKLRGCQKIAAPVLSHKSFYNGCALLQLTPVVFETPTKALPLPLFARDVEEALSEADALFLTSPDYYGNVADLQGIRALCALQGKPFIVDGAHGGHLHYNKELYAGAYADMWVDGVHKSLPAFTQGAVVSASKGFASELKTAVDTFRTTSPSYPIMASVEYAVKYPRNDGLERLVNAVKQSNGCFYQNADYTKLCVFAKDGFALERLAQQQGIYPEFSQENLVCFYLSPAQEEEEVEQLLDFLSTMRQEGRLLEGKEVDSIPAPIKLCDIQGKETEKVAVCEAVGRISASVCGLFPPCLPLIRKGEKITKEAITALQVASNRFGVENNQITVVKE